jgi:hypothetical protein
VIIRDLVLLCGYSRSGTTWLAKVLDTMPSVYMVSEPDKRINRQLKLGNVPHCLASSDDLWVDFYKEGIEELLTRVECNLTSIPFFRKNYLAVGYCQYLCVAFTWQIINFFLNNFGNRSIALPTRILKRSICSVDFVWKSVNQSSNLDFLIKTFPKIKIIYLLRNPFAAICSSLQNKSTKLDGQEYRRILERRDSLFFANNHIDLREVASWEEIEKRALLWRIECENAINTSMNYDRFYVVLYENLATNPTQVIQDIFKWLGWEKSKQTELFLLQSTGNKRPPWYYRIFGSGYFSVYKKPGGNIAGWKSKLAQNDFEKISAIVKTSLLMEYWPTHMLTK